MSGSFCAPLSAFYRPLQQRWKRWWRAQRCYKYICSLAAEADPVVHSFTKLADGFTDEHKAFNSAREVQGGRGCSLFGLAI